MWSSWLLRSILPVDALELYVKFYAIKIGDVILAQAGDTHLECITGATPRVLPAERNVKYVYPNKASTSGTCALAFLSWRVRGGRAPSSTVPIVHCVSSLRFLFAE